MKEQIVVSKINKYLHIVTQELCAWLEGMLPRVGKDWWNECVLDNLSNNQFEIARDAEYSQLSQFDLAALLRITDRAWIDMRSFEYLPTSQRECVQSMVKVRNNWAHIGVKLSDKDVVIRDIGVILEFFDKVIKTNKYSEELEELKKEIEDADFSAVNKENDSLDNKADEKLDVENSSTAILIDDIQEKDQVFLVSSPKKKGMVFAINEVSGIKKYDVFVDGDMKTFFEGQIAKVDSTPSYQWLDIETFKSNLTAHEINNPSASNLYSLNAGRIDFVPYQFRPALKMIKSDEPKILIADSVGVGKTIEAGIIVKELEARKELDNILVICPKPLVAERKWELEMKRFDEDFIALKGSDLRQIISDTHRDEEWPTRYNKAIVPYSILDSRVYEGEKEKHRRTYGLLDLDPAPHFDLVIIDEAHHIRNGSLEKEKAYAYKCVRYFCEHADAVVMLTATPLQTSDDNLFTLLNLLRPDVVMDKEVFDLMSRPNEYIYRASHEVRSASDNWQQKTKNELKYLTKTQWGENVIVKNPIYQSIMDRLTCEKISREERVQLVSDIESLHSFNNMINRTRRKDIQDFCVRRSYTIATDFTKEQEELHNELLQFEQQALAQMHDVRTIPFMISMIKRQASSSIFGLAPHIRDIINRRIGQLIDEPEFEYKEESFDEEMLGQLGILAQNIIKKADNLPKEDPKFESILSIIDKKNKQENNKIILFSSFRHTQAYLSNRLNGLGYRAAQINGSVKDEERRALRSRFELPREDKNAIDILLFTEVGSEGLDYQFCDTMINYDLPWNPMRIEQRIGRIDRRGQKSEVVHIYNIITNGTVDADIYERCLMRIGIFERSIGECEEVLGSIGTQIEQIAVNTSLTEEEKRQKFEQMADNEIRRMKELVKLEDEEKSLFGFDLSNSIATKEIKNAESPWISPSNIQKLVERYLNDRIGPGQYIIGSSGLKQFRLSREARTMLLEDFRMMSDSKSAQKRKWEVYLKGSEPLHEITFLSETATDKRRAFFITPMHPIVKQAAKYFANDKTSHIYLEYYSNDLPEGEHPFSIFAWNYVGINPKFNVVPVCKCQEIADELTDILQESDCSTNDYSAPKNTWDDLEETHIHLWQKAMSKYTADTRNVANYKLESIGSNYRNRKRTLEQRISEVSDEKVIRMYQSELNTATTSYNSKVAEINEKAERADIHTALIANGIINIKRT